MIHELLGGGGLQSGERKISIDGGNYIVARSCPSLTTSNSPSLTSSNVTSTAAAAASDTLSNSESQNLKCPRCNSSNTKFCYYNNYNLTQPRHFCKTCRRYWTKGGALRNVPIGGGCRKNKNANVSVAKASAARMKTVVSEIGRSVLAGQFDQGLPVASSPILWGSPQNSHFLALLRASHDKSPNPSSISHTVIAKEEGSIIGTRVATEPLAATNLMSGRVLDSDLQVEPPSLGLCKSFLWRNNQCQPQQHIGTLMTELPNDGLQELYQRLSSSSANNCAYNSPLFLNNPMSSSSSFLGSAPITGNELGYGNSMISSWPDIPTGRD